MCADENTEAIFQTPNVLDRTTGEYSAGIGNKGIVGCTENMQKKTEKEGENVPEAVEAVRVVVKASEEEAEELKDDVAVTLLDVAPVVVDEIRAVLEIDDDDVTEDTVTPVLVVMELELLDTTVLETATVEVVDEAVFGTSVIDG